MVAGRSGSRVIPFAVFARGPKTDGFEDIAHARAQLDHALHHYPDLHPVAEGVFGGVVDPRRLRFPFSHLEASDARDWQHIRQWAAELAERVPAASTLAS
jgi:menaquinone-dependent protoporphyrinogen IX oxidase